jgi:hypothetical protein
MLLIEAGSRCFIRGRGTGTILLFIRLFFAQIVRINGGRFKIP